ncbi:MAG: class I SAM-dependent methyltransferase, partial [Thermoplasmata archaeon]
RQVLREMYRVLRPGGRVVFLELPPSKAPGWLSRWVGGHRHGGGMAFLEADELKALVDSAGFQRAAWESGVRCYLTTATKPG